jgi:hypothetical protein
MTKEMPAEMERLKALVAVADKISVAHRDENLTLKAELAEARRDSARLDWLAQRPLGLAIETLWTSADRPDLSIRAAIDAAMKPAGS